MPKLDIDLFDEAPKVGDKVKVMGEVESIDEDSGEVRVSYDDVTIVGKDKKRKKRRDYNDDEDEIDVMNMPPEMNPNMQTLDQALAQSFPNTQ